MADKNTTHMLAYNGDSIFFSNETILLKYN